MVSLSLSKDTIWRIHWAPLAGESGWKCTRPGVAGSALPATSQAELWKAYLGAEEGVEGCPTQAPPLLLGKGAATPPGLEGILQTRNQASEDTASSEFPAASLAGPSQDPFPLPGWPAALSWDSLLPLGQGPTDLLPVFGAPELHPLSQLAQTCIACRPVG